MVFAALPEMTDGLVDSLACARAEPCFLGDSGVLQR
jgi:hypothetical protein